MEDELKVKIKIDSEDREIKDLDNVMKLLANNSRKTKAGLSDVEKTLTGVNNTSKKSKKDLNDVEKALTGVDKKGKSLKGADKNLKGIGAGAKGAIGGVNALSGAFTGLMTTMLPVLSVAAIVGFGKASLEAFGNFEKGMNSIFTLLPAKTAEAEKAMGSRVQKTMKQFGLSAEDTTNAVYNALSAGIPEDNVFKFIEDSAKSAKAGSASLDDAASTITTVMNNFRSSNLDSSHVSDLLFATIKKGVTTFPELASSIGDVLPSMASANVSFEQTSAAIATLTSTMGKNSTAKAGTALRAMMDELNNSSSKTSKTFKQLAGKDFKTFMVSGGDISQAIGLMKSKADSMGISVADMFQSVESKKAVNILNDNKKVFDENLSSFKDVTGATDEAYDKMNRGWAAMSSRMKSSFEATMINFGGAIAPVAELLGGAVLLGVDLLSIGFAGLGKVIEFLVNPIKDLQSAWSFLTGSTKDGTGVDGVAKDMSELSKVAQDVMPSLIKFKTSFDEMAKGIAEAFKPLTDKMGGFFKSVTGGSEGAGDVLSFFVDLATAGIEGLTPLITGIAGYVATAFGVITDVVGIAGGVYNNVFSSMGISTDDISILLQSLGVIAGAVFSTLGKAISDAWAIIKPILDPLLDILGKIVGTLAKISFNALKEGAGFVAGLLGGGKNTPQKKNALGSDNFTGGLTTISEQGKELFALPSGIVGMSPNKRTEMSFPAGTQIFSNKKTKNIIDTAKNLYSNKGSNVGKNVGGNNITIDMPINIANVTQQQLDKIKSLRKDIRAMVENILADKDSDNNYRLGVM